MKAKVLITVLVGLVVISIVTAGLLIPAKAEAKGKPAEPGDRAAEKAKAPALEKIEFIHWKRGFAKPPCNKDGICDPGENPSCSDCKNGDEEPPEPDVTCYAFMGQYGKKYLKWKTLPLSYVINPANSGLDSAFVCSAVTTSAETWDASTNDEVFTNYAECPIDNTAAYNVQNYVNAISFDDYYTNPDIIGACMVWWNPATKQIVEFDIVFETDFGWGDATATTTVMDLQNITTHELGHAVGLADVYDGACSDVTMYGYSGYGDTKKRTLEQPDITGIQKLYGAP